MKRINVKKNSIKWYTGLGILGFIAIAVLSNDSERSIFLLLYTGIVFSIIKWKDSLSAFAGGNYFLYDDQGIMKFGIGNSYGEDLFFSDINDVDFEENQIIFKHSKKKFRKKIEETIYTIHLTGYYPDDFDLLKAVFQEKVMGEVS